MAFDKQQKGRTEKAGKVLEKKILPERYEVLSRYGWRFSFSNMQAKWK